MKKNTTNRLTKKQTCLLLECINDAIDWHLSLLDAYFDKYNNAIDQKQINVQKSKIKELRQLQKNMESYTKAHVITLEEYLEGV